jgi:hypothetical protein
MNKKESRKKPKTKSAYFELKRLKLMLRIDRHSQPKSKPNKLPVKQKL